MSKHNKSLLSKAVTLGLLVGLGVSSTSIVINSSSLTPTKAATYDEDKQALGNSPINKKIKEYENSGLDDKDSNIKPDKYVTKEDFDDEEAYNAYLKDRSYVSTDAPEVSNDGDKPTVTVKNVTGTKKYTLNVKNSNGGHSLAVQRAFVGSTYIYITQRSENTTYLSRLTINKETGNSADYKDTMTLTSFGHTQTLEEFSYNGKYYFWIGCKGVLSINSPRATQWSTQMARIQYKAGETHAYTEFPRFSSLNRLNSTGSDNGTVHRSDGALSDTTNRLLIWTSKLSGTADPYIHYASYDTNKLNAIMDDAETKASKYVPLNDSRVLSAYVDGKTINKSPWLDTTSGIISYGSMQGLEFSAGNATYVSSGGNTSPAQAPAVAKYGWGSNTASKIKLNNSNFDTNTETEGLQIKGNDLLIGIDTHVSGASPQYIYSVDKSVF